MTPPANAPALSPDDLAVHEARFEELDARTLYAILRLRIDVFVVEQDCSFGDLDGRDLLVTTRHLWLEDPEAKNKTVNGSSIAAYARLLSTDHGDTEIGRVVTPAHLRGTGVGHRLMREAMARIEGPMYLKAQQRVSPFYASFGFEIVGEEFLEDAIVHVPMRHPGH